VVGLFPIASVLSYTWAGNHSVPLFSITLFKQPKQSNEFSDTQPRLIDSKGGESMTAGNVYVPWVPDGSFHWGANFIWETSFLEAGYALNAGATNQQLTRIYNRLHRNYTTVGDDFKTRYLPWRNQTYDDPRCCGRCHSPPSYFTLDVPTFTLPTQLQPQVFAEPLLLKRMSFIQHPDLYADNDNPPVLPPLPNPPDPGHPVILGDKWYHLAQEQIFSFIGDYSGGCSWVSFIPYILPDEPVVNTFPLTFPLRDTSDLNTLGGYHWTLFYAESSINHDTDSSIDLKEQPLLITPEVYTDLHPFPDLTAQLNGWCLLLSRYSRSPGSCINRFDVQLAYTIAPRFEGGPSGMFNCQGNTTFKLFYQHPAFTDIDLNPQPIPDHTITVKATRL